MSDKSNKENKPKKIQPRTLAGFEDLLPEDALLKEEIIHLFKRLFRAFGLVPIETPHLELTEMLIQETGGEIGKQLLRFEDNGGRDVCLRFDQTIPLARYYVQHQNELGLPFKRYAIGNCFRGERPQQGRLREFTQCDFDFIGTDSRLADFEILQIIATGFQQLGLSYTVKINHRQLLNSFVELLKLTCDPIDFIRLLDKQDKISAEDFNQELGKLGVNENQIAIINKFIELPDLVNSNDELLVSLSNITAVEGESPELIKYQSALKDLADIWELAKQFDFASQVKIMPNLARGFGYYTGVIFETVLDEALELGSVAGGGRYDNLTQNFSKDSLPAVGASFGLSRIMLAYKKLGKSFDVNQSDVLITNLTEEATQLISKTASELRTHGYRVAVYPNCSKLKKQLQYADRKSIPFIIIIGEDELEKSEYCLKDLRSGEQAHYSTVAELVSKMIFD